jgi:hypothetical protein
LVFWGFPLKIILEYTLDILSYLEIFVQTKKYGYLLGCARILFGIFKYIWIGYLWMSLDIVLDIFDIFDITLDISNRISDHDLPCTHPDPQP